MREMTTFIIALAAFLLGMAIAAKVVGGVAYDEGVRDEKRHWYIHAHNWGCDAETYKDNE